MTVRMANPVMILPEAMEALRALGSAGEKSGVSRQIVGLAQLRTSQINGCSVCVDAHCRQMMKAGESDERPFAVAAWRDAPDFTDAERAALALTEALTRLNDRGGGA
jgi:AhpD family alkylhydroperoxidase